MAIPTEIAPPATLTLPEFSSEHMLLFVSFCIFIYLFSVSLRYKLKRAENLFCSLLYPDYLEQCLVYDRHSDNISE